jgi:hypothetical protein
LEPQRDVGVIQVWVVAAAGADELERAGVAAFHPAIYDADRLAPQARRPAMAELTRTRERPDAPGGAQPRVTGIAVPGRSQDGTRPASRPSIGRDVQVSGTTHVTRPSSVARATAGVRSSAIGTFNANSRTLCRNRSAELDNAWRPTLGFLCHRFDSAKGQRSLAVNLAIALPCCTAPPAKFHADPGLHVAVSPARGEVWPPCLGHAWRRDQRSSSLL